MENFLYLNGLGSNLSSEALAGTLPQQQNSPQHVAHGLYAEQISGAAFTALRHQNLRSWQYRIKPSACHNTVFEPAASHLWVSAPTSSKLSPPTQLRWDPMEPQSDDSDFISGMVTYSSCGCVHNRIGGAIHLYNINRSMDGKYFYNADGELLIIPQHGRLLIHTEMGRLAVGAREIAVIPRGIRFQVLVDEPARGYVLENYGQTFQLPERGLIGANGLAEERHFQIPTAWFEQESDDYTLLTKYNGQLWQCAIKQSPLDVVAWHGNYYPYKYKLDLFMPAAAVRTDHSDPSIYTLLTSPSPILGVGNLDLTIFTARWLTSDNTFRPPYYHRNVMSEFMGLIEGEYDGKSSGFYPGGASLHNCMTGHGVDSAVYNEAISKELKPEHYNNTLAFLFESSRNWQVTAWALNTPLLQKDYLNCWQSLPLNFKKKPPN